jgi:hypothetical protein
MKIYVDPEGSNKVIVIVSKTGDIQKVYTPFRAICIKPVVGISLYTQVYVDAVYGTQNGKILFVIFKQTFLHSNFQVMFK